MHAVLIKRARNFGCYCVVEMLCACEPAVNISAQVVFTQNGLKCHCLKAGLFDPNFSLE